ncbi:MAG: acetolactate synthase small subunit, partial [Thiogranum sp.]|nr:acetolactate synthase small subunit [Thiogranum sp.]
ADIFRGRIIDVTDSLFTIEVTGTSDKLDAFVRVIDQSDIIEVVRSGVTGIARGEKALRV